MKKISATTKLTLSAMSTALSVVFLYAASVIPTAKLALCFLIIAHARGYPSGNAAGSYTPL